MTALGDARWPDLQHGPATLLVPLGSCEQHGPHLPLATDTDIAHAVATRVAATRTAVWVAPPLAYGASGEHAGFPGTLSIGTEVLTLVLVELVRSADWAARVILVNGHGGNIDGVRRAFATLRAEGRSVDLWLPAIEGGDAHAGHTETSLMLALAGACYARTHVAGPTPGAEGAQGGGVGPVRMQLAEAGATAPLRVLLPALRAGGVRAVSPNGVLGDPTGATANEGRRLFDALVASLGALVDG